MNNILVSIVIPYKDRLDNIELVLEALSRQNVAKQEFEIVVGVMEYSVEYVTLCKKYEDKINIRSVMISDPWQVALARNIAIKQAVGEVLVFLDVDMVVSPGFVKNIYENHFSSGQNQCVIGQMIDYDNNNSDVDFVQVKPFDFYQSQIDELDSKMPVAIDERWKVEYHLPWAFVWTALVAIPRRLVVEFDLVFDLNFHGYGVEDLEWALRIHKSGIPILRKEDVWGIHLPHVRNLTNNKRSEGINYQYFLKKWPANDVELVSAFGDFEGNNMWLEFSRELSSNLPREGTHFSIVSATTEGKQVLYLGAVVDENKNIFNINDEQFVNASLIEVIPVLGLRLPFDDQTFDACIVLPGLDGFSTQFLERITEESQRVSKGGVNRD